MYVKGLKEENSKYYLNREHDKIFRTLLDNKKEAIKFINKTLNTHLKEENIEKYNSSFVNKIFQNEEADIVYKFKDNNIFFLIEHQTKIDYSMPYRILEYEMEIIKSAINKKNIKNKSYKFPLVIPIVLYTGKRKWNAEEKLEKIQEKLDCIDLKSLSNYNLVDVNDFTEEELLKEDTLISKIMLLEKARNAKEMVEILEKIILKIKDDDKEILRRIISIILEKKLGKEKSNYFIKKLKGVDKNMLAVLEMIEKENQMYINIGKKEGKLEGKKEGKKEGKIEIIKNMIKEKLPIETITKITGVNKEEIEKIMEYNEKEQI